MRILTLLTVAIQLSKTGLLVSAQQKVQPRFDPTCGLLLNNIYCFGGTTVTANGDDIDDQNINLLDLTENNGILTEELGNKWVTINSDAAGVDLRTRSNPLGMALPDGETMVLIGGQNTDANRPLVDQAIAFNAKNRKWTSYPNYEEPPYGKRQIRLGSTAYIPSKGIAVYGGREVYRNDSWTLNGQNITAYNYGDTVKSRNIGFTSLTFFDINNSTSPWSIPSPQDNLPTKFSAYQASVFDPKTNTVYYLGGGTMTTNGTITYQPFSEALMFNLTTGTWGTQQLIGVDNNAFPSNRNRLTATLLPSTRDILVYGGETSRDNYRPVDDFCYTLNLDTFTWTRQPIRNAPATAKLARAGHSAVLLNNTLFIVFGRDSRRSPMSSTIALDVSNPSNITFVEKYVNPNLPLNTNTTNGNGATEVKNPQTLEPSSQLGTGAIAGIAAGAAVAGILGILALIFCLRKQKKNAAKRKRMEEENLRGSSNTTVDLNDTPAMEVNWDEIEKNYVEVPSKHLTYSANLTDDTVVNGDQVKNNPMLIQKEFSYFQRPDATEEETFERPDAIEDMTPISQHPRILKPDGGFK